MHGVSISHAHLLGFHCVIESMITHLDGNESDWRSTVERKLLSEQNRHNGQILHCIYMIPGGRITREQVTSRSDESAQSLVRMLICLKKDDLYSQTSFIRTVWWTAK